ncbi:MAG TPA: M23 family metallopeptidase [Anaerolineae bacterium]
MPDIDNIYRRPATGDRRPAKNLLSESSVIGHRSSVVRCILLVQTLLLAVVSACQTEQVASAGIAANGSAALADATTQVKPVIVYTMVPTDLPPPVLATPVATSQTVQAAAETEAIASTATPQPLPSSTATASLTPLPTFTPPALPLTLPDEHYWLRRPVAEGGVVWTDKAYPYGSTRGGALRTHHGVEFNVDRGTQILAAASGTVVVAGDDLTTAYGPETNFYGRLVIVELDSRLDSQPVYTLYGHLSEVLVNVGQHVQAEQVIALSGASGVADGPHMHFEVRVGQNDYDSTRNPLLWLYPFPDRGTVVGRVVWPDGRLVTEAPVSLRRIDAPSRYAATTTYADDSVNADPIWQENFALDDADAGYYEVVVTRGEDKFTAEVWVFPYRTSFVEIVLK